MIRRILTIAMTLSLVGCAAQVGTGGMSIPSDAALTCQNQCAAVGMGLSGIVTMAANVGCVCQPRGSVAMSPADAAAFGGTAAVLGQEAARQQQQQQQLRAR